MGSIRFEPPPTPEDFTLAAEVFGIARGKIPRNYVDRPEVDTVLRTAIMRRQHVVIHGSSKQGKTCVRRKNLNADQCIEITCLSTWTIEAIFRRILVCAGHEFPTAESRTESYEQRQTKKRGIRLKMGELSEASLDQERSGGSSQQSQTSYSRPAGDLADANDVIDILKALEFQKTIVLEDFHYLSVEVQQQFSVALKAFFDSSDVQFIIVGVWLDKNRLVQYNGDLAGRMVAIDADAWTRDKIGIAIGVGERLLDIQFNFEFKEALLDRCMNSIWVAQEVCFRACQRAGALTDVSTHGRVIGTAAQAEEFVREVVGTSTARFKTFITGFAIGLEATRFDLHRWILGTVLYSGHENLDVGIPLAQLQSFIERFHPAGLISPGSLREALQQMGQLQIDIRVNPIVLDFDMGLDTLNIVDRAFLIWLAYQDRTGLMNQAGLPDGFARQWRNENVGTGTYRMVTLSDGRRIMISANEPAPEDRGSQL